jgi:tetratricopeptide (TPR) repeat protein
MRPVEVGLSSRLVPTIRFVPKKLAAVLLVVVIAIGALLLGRRPAEPGPIVVLALDGLDPEVVSLLAGEGRLPHLARLRAEGAWGPLRSTPPLLSPVVWTTIATGREPSDHGIGHFVARDDASGEPLPVTADMRRVQALWQIFSGQGRKVGVVGWWATWPAEDVRGTVVSDHLCYHFLFPQGAGTGQSVGRLVSPPERLPEVAALVRRPADVTAAEASRFVSVPDADLRRPFAFGDELGHFRWALATADTHRRIGLHLLERDRPDLLLVYVEMTDSLSHLFGHLFRAQGLAGELAVQQQRYGRAVEEAYVYADGIVGDYMAALGDDGTLVVVSDHGFALGTLPADPSTTRDMRRVSEEFHRPDGVVGMWGPRVRRSSPAGARTLDVTPTLLALAGLPAAQDMPGRVLSESLLDAHPTRIASYERSGAKRAATKPDAGANEEIVERLRSLGYLGAGTSAETPSRRSPENDRTLAALHFKAGRLQEAAAAYGHLLAEEPDDAALHASLAGVLGALGRDAEALKHVERALALQPLNAEALHNRGVLHERGGDRSAAERDYRSALVYEPSYEPSRKALERLTGVTDPRAPVTEAERRASDLAEHASEAARRGDYATAERELAEAERIAPRYVLVYQYQSNVSYLKGDRAAARRALQKALALEPDNALFRANLARLER